MLDVLHAMFFFLTYININLLSYSSIGQKSNTSLTQKKLRCQQTVLLSGNFKRKSIFVAFPASRGYLYSLAYGPFPTPLKKAAQVLLKSQSSLTSSSASLLHFLKILLSLIYNYMKTIMVTRYPPSTRPPSTALQSLSISVVRWCTITTCLICFAQSSLCRPHHSTNANCNAPFLFPHPYPSLPTHPPQSLSLGIHSWVL